MGIQEIIVFSVVLLAAGFAAMQFIRQFTHGDAAAPKCAKCELTKIVTAKPKDHLTGAGKQERRRNS
jgi:hypothetical protein